MFVFVFVYTYVDIYIYMYLYIHIYTQLKTKIGPHYGCMPIFLGQKNPNFWKQILQITSKNRSRICRLMICRSI